MLAQIRWECQIASATLVLAMSKNIKYLKIAILGNFTSDLRNKERQTVDFDVPNWQKQMETISTANHWIGIIKLNQTTNKYS